MASREASHTPGICGFYHRSRGTASAPGAARRDREPNRPRTRNPVQSTAQRPMAESLDRPEVIHCIASVLAEFMHDVIGNPGSSTNQAYFAALCNGSRRNLTKIVIVVDRHGRRIDVSQPTTEAVEWRRKQHSFQTN